MEQEEREIRRSASWRGTECSSSWSGALLQGAPVSTFDLDVAHSTEDANITRLLAKDLAVPPVLRRALEERQRRGGAK